MTDPEFETPNALAALLRWEASGATWELRTSGAERAVVDLCTCDGGQVVGRLVSSDPDFLAHVRGSVRE
ncbi:hypothetical protein [Raineyella fluvialis]|uniref:Uncharacterized protein n=1 Tax=Raineyella fluvialis TaxID=2662261 RepID=A0A5Q2FCN8_9ACTN|nr:hypothetical protein [Raineyella fluvialis]QGF24559.1 hypothetical protein Rai3103_13945 [Raineyella fluvialis]